MTSAKHARSGNGLSPFVPSIPLTAEPVRQPGEQSIGTLVKEATTHLSTLLRSEVELARAEITTEIKKGVRGSILFILALAVAAFSMFFLFFTVAEAISVVLPRWAGFGITFLLMLAGAGLFGLLGYLRVRKIRKPERTISTVRDTAKAVTRHRADG